MANEPRGRCYLSVEPRTILLWARQGHVKGFTLSGTLRVTWRFLHADLDATLTSPSVALNEREDSVRQRNRSGSVVFDKRIKTWNFFWGNGKRRSKKIGTISQYPTKASMAGSKAAARCSRKSNESHSGAPTVNALVEQYRAEKMPKRWTRIAVMNRGLAFTSCRSGEQNLNHRPSSTAC